MSVVIGEVAPLAMGIALSPFPVVPAILLLFTPRARTTSGAFLVGWVAGILVAAAVFTALASVIERSEETPTWASWTKTGLGVVLFFLGAGQWSSRAEKPAPAWMQTLTEATPAKALRLGLLMSAVNPKVLLLAAAAGLTIGSAELTAAGTVTSLVVFTALAAVTVAFPLLLHVVAGARVLTPLGRAKDWLATHNAAVTALVVLAIGALLIAEGAAGL
ncbi:GAP family protein [Peterkaempfera sp. SMS 1(5)a]|uniref:GAP family protein n=1 Tax=Peterkaempfera podocarpi TaxID=3232308 RepID=UPI00366B7A56